MGNLWSVNFVMSQDTDELFTCTINNVEDGGVTVGRRELFNCDDIAFFSLIFLFHSVPLLPLHSTPPLTHDPPIFLYFLNCCHALCSSAPLC